VDRIDLTGLEVFAHHGALPHERELGQRFVVDVGLDLDLSAPARTDDLGDTVDYGHLATRVVEAVAGEAYDLLETVAGRVADVCLADPRVAGVEVTIRKPHAPLPVVAREVAVTLRRTRP
jgi:7,8-dihydroneopterin aldolase/epimerase/oxygenase